MRSLTREALKRVPLVRTVVRTLRLQWQIRQARAGWKLYAATHERRALNIGSGIRMLPGWFNVDNFVAYRGQFFMDAAKPFPMPNDTFDFVRSEHMIEHVPYLSAMSMLRECFRTLRPGGIIRIATPDLRKLARLYETPPSPVLKRYADAIYHEWRDVYQGSEVGVLVNNAFLFEDHFFIYDSGTLGEGLRRAGFVDVVVSSPGQTEHDFLRGTDLHATEDDYIAFETLTMEARKAA